MKIENKINKFLSEANEEEIDKEYNFERFLSLLSTFEGDGKEQIKAIVKDGKDGKYRRVLFEIPEFEKLNKMFTGAKNIVNIANSNGFYIFKGKKYVAITEYKDYPRKDYVIQGDIKVIGKDDLD